MKTETPFLVLLWGILGGLVMFMASAFFYPYLGLPPAWLIGLPVASMVACAAILTFF